eukprot:1193300-Prorocentrum_minimum.AAC.1
MEIPFEQNWEAAKRAKRSESLVILNVAPIAPVPPAALHNIDYLVVNETEASGLAELNQQAIRWAP